MVEPLFPPDFLARVATLRVRAQRRGGERGGGHLGDPSAAAGFELADTRGYTAGDDLRTVDWAALARLDEAVVRRTRDATPAELAVVVDRTPSMGFGEPTKDVAARRVAGAVGAVAIASGARARLVGEGPSTASSTTWLTRLERAKPTASVVAAAGRAVDGRRGTRRWLLLSDLYESKPLAEVVERARARGDAVCVALVRSIADVEPPDESAELVDAETGERRPWSAADRAEFARRRERFESAWRERCARTGAAWVELRAESPWEVSARAVLAAQGSAA